MITFPLRNVASPYQVITIIILNWPLVNFDKREIRKKDKKETERAHCSEVNRWISPPELCRMGTLAGGANRRATALSKETYSQIFSL